MKILNIANEAWGFRNPKRKRTGGNPLTRSGIYKLLSQPFYYGLMVRMGNSYSGVHRPMITKDEFDRVQEFLGRVQRPSNEKHVFAYRSLIRCGECGATVTPEEKVNRFGSHYIYYHCSKRLPGTHCQQRTIRLEELERQIIAALTRIHVADDFRDWALGHLSEIHGKETQALVAIDQSLDVAYRECQKKLDALTELRIRGLLTDDEYAAKRQDLLGEQLRLKKRLADTDARATSWRELAERAFVFANEAKQRFEKGSLEDKREILVALGSNLTLKDRILRIQLAKPFQLFQEGLEVGRSEIARLEPREKLAAANENSGQDAASLVWLGIVDAVRTFFLTAPDTIPWPLWCMKKR